MKTALPRLAGAGLLVAIGAVHLDLYLTGYRTIPTIGWLFLLQAAASLGLGGAVLVFPRSVLPAAAGSALALATLGGYLLSLRMTLFGFREVRTTAGIVAGSIEVVAFAVLAVVALGSRRAPMANRPARGLPSTAPGRRAAASWASGAVAVLAAVALGLSLAGSPSTSSASSARPVLRIATVKGVRIVTDGRGRTLYWFVPDTSTRSTCYGTCAVYWPPVVGRPVAGAGVARAELGTVARSDGTTQATYAGHPLYTYVADAAPGQANGDGIDLNGGVWHQMEASG